MSNILTGNFNNDSSSTRGWIMGHFMPEGSPFKTENVEVKWGKHKKGESKEIIGTNDLASSLAILLSGEFMFNFPSEDKKVMLTKPGDYIYYSPKTAHSWEVMSDCLILTIRWPSIAGDQKKS